MTDQAHLERGYRRLLAWYPRAFRRENGPEILAVLMACAQDGQRRPGLAESADLISSGLRMRLRPSMPRPARTVRAAVRLMYAGAAVSTANLIFSVITLAFIGPSAVTLRLAGRSQPLPVATTAGIAGGLVVIALWLWMARAAGQGRNWARMLSTVLFGLATLELISIFSGAQSVLGLFFWAPTWLVGLAAVWLLWRPASSAFFNPQGFARMSSVRPTLPRQPPRSL
jgi:hypothetical protein